MIDPYLLFEFTEGQDQHPLAFTSPVKILQTDKLEEVPEIIKEIDKAIRAGFYAAGYLSYEAAPAFHSEMEVHHTSALPLIWFGIFTQPIPPGEEKKANKDYSISNWKLTASEEDYQQGIEEIKHAIEEGHTYQVNYTERLQGQFKGSDFSFYRQLTRNQQSSYSAYLHLGKYRILSASPELFFKVHNQKITAKPMKGTAPRGRFTEEDQKNLKNLLTSEKEQAENLMIVDLLRNDIGRIAKPGSVKVTRLFEAETYPTVHQLTSTIEADLVDDITIWDWFQALFPCGSITGAPKISTMRYISLLEQSPREVYCGAIGYITPERNAIFNVPIRTVFIDSEKETATYGVGGGITWDSTPVGEFRELHTKAQLLSERRPEFHLLESIKLENGYYPILSYHLDRIKESGNYFQFRINIEAIKQKLGELAMLYANGTYKVRLVVKKNGEISIEAEKVYRKSEPVRCTLASSPIDKNDPFLFHKTTHRQIYETQHKTSPAQTLSVLMWNQNEELTEFTLGNLVVEKEGKLFTPPVSSGLLPGTFRQYLLDQNRIETRTLYKHELHEYDAVWFINSVRGWLKVELI
ncbi:aminodeoxychorismate synthase component I [Sediminibacillus albus]|uniref:Para-aminobenzoate synthetase / 4-amino-4-deoxychorismate lyase n=1 Tax=Sediminibacillus albus TaxID=407036 RepID=A0A1G8YU67_9BACI|nr:aminodeoxychorismate synthase component I [Sediminibacillus albus]SDK06341.1 para-aminobenzoate synthetase / 4-amino-4-deoxychorismate lyase [Sediminibacillus albus]